MNHNSRINDTVSRTLIGAAIEVHKTIGPGLLESAYAKCLRHELQLQRIAFASEVMLPVHYKGLELETGYRLDLIVEDQLLVELKAVNAIDGIHKAQLLTYLRLSGLKTGLLINFNAPTLKQGIIRMVN